MDKVNTNQYAEIRHHKYKRCLAMALWCNACLYQFPSFGTPSKKEKWWSKWHDKWLDIAESALKAGYNKVCFKDEADKVIAELNDKCQMHDFFWEGCGFAKRGFKNTIAVSEAFDNLEADNRRLKRALWMARASEASKEVNYWTCQDESSYAIVDFNVRHETIVSYKAPHHRPYKWILIWENVERKCRAKAEEYK